jgi:hypothetical protein
MGSTEEAQTMGGTNAPRTPDVMRRVNELVWEGLTGSGRTEPIAFFCECADSGCYRPAWLTLAEFERVRDDPDGVVTAPEHAATAGLVRIA